MTDENKAVEEKRNKLYMTIFLVGMLLTSLVVAWIMAKNHGKDTTKERFKLTNEYKVIKKESYAYDSNRGQRLYNQLCARCHKPDGSGMMQTPPLSGSKIVQDSPSSALKIMVRGLTGKIERNGKSYNSIMPSFRMIPHKDLAHVLNYIRNSFGNEATGEDIHHVEVVKAKVDTITIKGPLQEKDL
ncbi:MAG: mono/diheme cytochrome c family protein [Bacteriovoracaceae bacterium]|jgi:mono/diheme cytochrome c family protein